MLNRPGQPHGGLSQSWIVFWFVLKDPSHHPGHLHLRQFPVVSLVSVQGPAPTVEPNIFGSFCSISNCSCQSVSSTEHSRASPPWTILLTDIWEENEELDIPIMTAMSSHWMRRNLIVWFVVEKVVLQLNDYENDDEYVESTEWQCVLGSYNLNS